MLALFEVELWIFDNMELAVADVENPLSYLMHAVAKEKSQDAVSLPCLTRLPNSPTKFLALRYSIVPPRENISTDG
jgi:hypothetical protein